MFEHYENKLLAFKVLITFVFETDHRFSCSKHVHFAQENIGVFFKYGSQLGVITILGLKGIKRIIGI